MKGSDEVWRNCWTQWSAKTNYQEDIQQHLEERGALYEILRAGLEQTGAAHPKVLEVGCGSAVDACVLAQDPRLTVVGIDRSIDSARVAQRISASFTRKCMVAVGDARALCFPSQTFDLVYSQGFLEHFRDPLPLLKEQVRVLKPTGRLVIDVPQKYAGLGLYSLRKQWRILRGTWPWGWETQYSYGELVRLGAAVGLAPEAVAGYGFDGLFNLLANPHVMIEKKGFLRRSRLAQLYKHFYLRHLRAGNERFWKWACRRYGHRFLICIAVRFRKGGG